MAHLYPCTTTGPHLVNYHQSSILAATFGSRAEENFHRTVSRLDMPAPVTPCSRVHSPRPIWNYADRTFSLPHPDDEIPSGSEEDVSSMQDGGTAWVMADPASTLERHLVIKDGAKPIHRDSHDKRHCSPNPECRFVPNRLPEQTRLSILNWNPGPRRGKEGAIEKHNAGKWHIIALQEAIKFLQQGYLTSL